MPEVGTTYRCNLPPRHIWVVISDPNQNEQAFVFVNLTSLNDNCVDDACILQPEDYPPYLTQPTTVAYSRHQIGTVSGMNMLKATGRFFEMPPIPVQTLQKIINGAHDTLELSKTAKDMLPPRV
jgi:hypothetical protein